MRIKEMVICRKKVANSTLCGEIEQSKITKKIILFLIERVKKRGQDSDHLLFVAKKKQ
jgi:hypothetical protein